MKNYNKDLKFIFSNKKSEKLFHNACIIIELLENEGYTAELVGGCVRDRIINRPVKDFDVVTNADYGSVKRILETYNDKVKNKEVDNTYPKFSIDEVGANFGIIIASGVEIGQYREEDYDKGSHGKPSVTVTRDKRTDSNRRDFTMNSLYMSIRGEITDYHNGVEHIKQKLIVPVGQVDTRFQEDSSRILRALYLKGKLGFEYSDELKEGIKRNNYLMRSELPKEQIGKKIKDVIEMGNLDMFFEDAIELELTDHILSEFSHIRNLPQNPLYHDKDVLGHISAVIKESILKYPKNEVMQLASMYHDVAKGLEGIRGVNSKGQPNDLGHEEKGAEIALDRLTHYGFNKSIVTQVVFLVRHHGLRLDENASTKSVLKSLRKLSLEFKTKEQLVEGVTMLFDFMLLDASGFNKQFSEQQAKTNRELYKKHLQLLKEHAFYTSDLEIKGNEIMDILGVKGKEVGLTMQKLIHHNLYKREDILIFLKRKGNK